MIDLVIFDCDGVLVDSEPLASRVLSAYLTEQGVPMTPEACRNQFTGWSLRSVDDWVAENRGRHLPSGWLEELRARDEALFEAELRPIPGVRKAVSALDRPVCVASSGRPEKIRHSLTLTGLIDLFAPHLFSAVQVAHGKPAPDLFLFAAETMGVAPGDCLVIEDSPAGVEAARAAGMAVFGFTGGGHVGPGWAERLKAAGAHRLFALMADLPGLVDQASKA